MANSERFDRWLSVVTDFVLPAGVLTALLFYFGYAFTRAEYKYFGIDIDAVGLNTSAFLIRSPHSLVVPIVVVSLLGALGISGHLAVRHLAERSDEVDGRRTSRLDKIRRMSHVSAWIGIGIVLCGVVLLLAYPWFVEW